MLPGVVPEESITAEIPPPSPHLLEKYEDLGVNIIKAKGLTWLPSLQRHGPLLRMKVFYSFQESYEHILSATLLDWLPGEFSFRGTVYALLCLASANGNFSMIPVHMSQKHGIGYTSLESNPNEKGEPEFLAHLEVGCHLRGFTPGSSPDTNMYWFDGALINLVAQFAYWPEIFNAEVARVVEYCQNERLNQCVNAVLLSIEHIVLMRIHPSGRVEHTEPLHLFDYEYHLSSKASERYSAEVFKPMQVRQEKLVKNMELKIFKNKGNSGSQRARKFRMISRI